MALWLPQFPDPMLPETHRAPLDLIDAHNHLQDPRFGEELPEILADMLSEHIVHCIVNGTCEDDWPQVAALHQAQSARISPAFGLHPWKSAGRSSDWSDKLRQLLLENPQASIGECGLDLWIRNADIADQLAVLGLQMSLSRELDRPLSVHCLKAWPHFMQLLASTPPLPPFLLHSFNGPQELIPSLCQSGAHFSFSGYFLHPRKQQAMQTFRHIPDDRLLIETDAPAMAPPENFQGKYHREAFHHPADMALTVAELARMRGISTEVCAQLTASNARRLFRLKKTSALSA